jgi:hypothetical protein
LVNEPDTPKVYRKGFGSLTFILANLMSNGQIVCEVCILGDVALQRICRFIDQVLRLKQSRAAVHIRAKAVLSAKE